MVANQRRVDVASSSWYAGRLFLRAGTGRTSPRWEEVVVAFADLAEAAGR